MRRLIITVIICLFIVSVSQATDETHKDSKHLEQAATIVFEDPANDFKNKKEDITDNKKDEDQISVLNKLKSDITTFSKEHNINEFYIFPFLAGLLLGPFVIAGTYIFSINHPKRKLRVRSVFAGWTWWIIAFSLVLIYLN